MARDYYAVLEVGIGASSVQIRRAYQRLARRYSPDVNLWEHDTQSLFEEVVQAYRVLSDPTTRSVYDRQGGQAPARQEPSPAGVSAAGRRGDDATVAVELSFAQSATGMAANVPVERLSPCEACAATGGRVGALPTPCQHCGGTGSVWRARGAVTGKGDNLYTESVVTIAEAVLGGRVSLRTLEGVAELVVPAGTQSGQVLRMRGRGLPRLAGDGRGDLYVTVRVEIPRGIDARTQELFRELGRLLPRQEVRP